MNAVDNRIEPSGRDGRDAAFRVVAAGLAGLPIGFAASAVLGGRLLTTPDDAGATLLALGAFGALFAAGIMAFAATLLSAKAARRTTMAVGAVSAAVVVYLVFDFVADRMARLRSFDAAYAALPTFELAFTARDLERRPFSTLTYDSETRAYTARRPGSWLCEGKGARGHNMALFEGLRAAQDAEALAQGSAAPEAEADDCKLRASWRMAQGPWMVSCAATTDERLVAAADRMVEETERKSSCRRAEAP